MRRENVIGSINIRLLVDINYTKKYINNVIMFDLRNFVIILVALFIIILLLKRDRPILIPPRQTSKIDVDKILAMKHRMGQESPVISGTPVVSGTEVRESQIIPVNLEDSRELSEYYREHLVDPEIKEEYYHMVQNNLQCGTKYCHYQMDLQSIPKN